MLGTASYQCGASYFSLTFLRHTEGDGGVEFGNDSSQDVQRQDRATASRRSTLQQPVVSGEAMPPLVRALKGLLTCAPIHAQNPLTSALWQAQRCPSAERPLAPAATVNLEPFLGVDATQFLMVQSEAFALQQDVQAAIAKAASHRGNLAHADP
jgi:hypothetical protein